MNLYKLTLLSLLASLATVGRIAFSTFFYIPNVQPVTALVIISGIWLGPVGGIAIAVISTLLSNMILGMGIWTLSQILVWASIGLISGLLGRWRKQLPVWIISLYGLLAGYAYGFVISLTYGSIGDNFWAYYVLGLPYDTYHAVGNVAFIIVLYPVLSRLFKRYAEQQVYMKALKITNQ